MVAYSYCLRNPGEPERDSGMMVKADSAMKPNSFRPIGKP
jgi:hypothetical protein